jgi:hypothetical protein
MKLAAIYNVFDGEELLAGSVDSVAKDVDVFIFVVSTVGQSGERYNGGLQAVQSLQLENKVIIISNDRERKKRNIGIQEAKRLGCSHFILMDCDEYWHGLDRTQIDCVHRLYTYFKEPTYQLDPPEDYYVPGICTLHPNTRVGYFNCGFYCDPTRMPNHQLKLGTTWMHHYSYIRNNIDLKIRNSSAVVNIQAKRQQLESDLKLAEPGYFCEFWQKSIILVPNYFHINLGNI